MTSVLTPLDQTRLEGLRTAFDEREANHVAMNAVTQVGIDEVAHNYNRSRLLQHRFSVSIDNGTVTSQAHSGRCWLFSSLNVARFVARRTLNIDGESTANPMGDFELSQNYAMYFDKLERVNYFLRDVAALVLSLIHI